MRVPADLVGLTPARPSTPRDRIIAALSDVNIWPESVLEGRDQKQGPILIPVPHGDGRDRFDSYVVADDMVTVHYGPVSRSSQIGGMRPKSLAEMILRELIDSRSGHDPVGHPSECNTVT